MERTQVFIGSPEDIDGTFFRRKKEHCGSTISKLWFLRGAKLHDRENSSHDRGKFSGRSHKDQIVWHLVRSRATKESASMELS